MKISISFPPEMMQEILAEAFRIDRSVSWVLQNSWRHSRAAIKRIPTMYEPEELLQAGDKDSEDSLLSLKPEA